MVDVSMTRISSTNRRVLATHVTLSSADFVSRTIVDLGRCEGGVRVEERMEEKMEKKGKTIEGAPLSGIYE